MSHKGALIDLGKRFIDRWKPKENEETLTGKIKNLAKPQDNLKEQIGMVTQRLDTQTKTLDAAVQRFEIRDADIFKRIVKALSERDEQRAHILATELCEIRKVEKMLTHASLGLQSVSMRLRTVSEMGDLVAVLSPAKSVLNGIRNEMCTIMPEASNELGNIGNLLGDIVTTTNQSSDMPMNPTKVNEEAAGILQEAMFAAERQLERELPQVTGVGGVKKRATLEA